MMRGAYEMNRGSLGVRPGKSKASLIFDFGFSVNRTLHLTACMHRLLAISHEPWNHPLVKYLANPRSRLIRAS